MKIKKFKNYFVFLLISFIAGEVFARERVEFYNGIRYLGMGNSSVAVTNDETALVVNPAALGRLRDFYGTIIDPELESNRGASDIYRLSAFSEPFKPDVVIPSAVAAPDTYYHARGQIMPSFVAKNFGIGFLMKYDLNALANPAGTEVDTFYRDDMALLLGYNLQLFGGRVKIGFTGKAVSRIEINETNLDPTQDLSVAVLGEAGLAKEGLGVGVDAAIILAAPWTLLPTLTAVVRDVGGTKFDKAYGNRLSTSTERPEEQAQDIDVGAAIFPIHSNFVRSSWSIEYRGLLSAQDEDDKAKLMHGGVELNMGDVFFLRAGLNQRYWTAGAELASERFQLQVATYGEEVGTADSYQEDRRYAFKFSFRF